MITVLFNIDSSFGQHLGVCIASLLQSNPNNLFRIIVASPTMISAQDKAALLAIVEAKNASIEIVVYDAVPAYEHLPVHSHLAPVVYLRLFMTEYVDPTVSRLIYLDSDVIVCKDIGALWATDLGDAYFGAAPEPYDERQRTPLGFGPDDLYVNAGVMLVNLAKWRADNVLPRLLEFANDNQAILPSADQDTMNSVFRGSIINIGYEWNWQALFPRFSAEQLRLSESDYNRLRSSPNIVHYTSRYKPWYYRWEPHYKELYYKSLRMTPWSNYVPPDRAIRNVPTKLAKLFQQKMEWYLPRLSRSVRLLLASRRPTDANLRSL